MSDRESSFKKPERACQHINGNQESLAVNSTPSNGPRVHQANPHPSQKEKRDPNMDINLPYRTLTAEADFSEYTAENPMGAQEGPLEPYGQNHYKMVTFAPNDPENPKNWSKAYKWYCTMVVATTCFVVAFSSAVITADLVGVQEEFNVSQEVALLTITVFVVGFGVGKY